MRTHASRVPVVYTTRSALVVYTTRSSCCTARSHYCDLTSVVYTTIGAEVCNQCIAIVVLALFAFCSIVTYRTQLYIQLTVTYLFVKMYFYHSGLYVTSSKKVKSQKNKKVDLPPPKPPSMSRMSRLSRWPEMSRSVVTLLRIDVTLHLRS